MFHIIRLDTNKPICDLEGAPLIFSNGKDATYHADLWSQTLQVKCQPRQIGKEDTSWHAREQNRFDTGEYLVWEKDDIKKLEEEYRKNTGQYLFAHISNKDPQLISFVKDNAAGIADRHTTLPLEKFLRRYFNQYLNEEDIKTLVAEHIKRFTDQPFKLAITPAEIEAVYINYAPDCRSVAESCMRFKKWKYGEHPCRVYGAGDLAIAYLTNSKGKTTHRALCWPEKKLYSRMYADDDQLHVRLKWAGYRKSDYYLETNPNMAGARLLKILADCRQDDATIYIMPYIDGQIRVKAKRGDNNFLYFTERGSPHIETKCTHGCSSEEVEEEEEDNIYFCERCNHNCEHVFEVRQFPFPSSTHELWCEDCVDNHSFRSDFGGRCRYNLDTVPRIIIDNRVYTQVEYDRYINPIPGLNLEESAA